ncbi:MAG TPA: winged helix-turn-helix domain-containing protein [Terriglobales bacterium]|nr:winged helix-turn-helix domain-containing protein [Terriglobales bacterium]
MSRLTNPVHFGVFELDVRTGELRKDGLKIKLQGQPVQVLIALLECPSEIVTREELRQRLWPSDTFVDFEHNLNSAVKRLREALGDSADNPRFIETLPRHGYRFIAPAGELERPAPRSQSRVRAFWIGALVLVAIVAVAVSFNLAGFRQRLFGRAQGAHIRSLAVLPLENLSGKAEEEYFADGMTEELITDLGRIHALRVISRQSVMHYKGTDKPLPQIASELKVEALIQGSALRAGNRVRITMQLVRAVPEEHLWAESYERDLRDVIDLQREVAQDITTQIKLTLTPQEQTHLTGAHPRSPEAYRAYLLVRYFGAQRPHTRSTLEKAVSYYEQAIKLDPDYAPAWAGLASIRDIQTGVLGLLPVEEGYRKMREAAERAVALDPNLAEAHEKMGAVKMLYEFDLGRSG